MIYLLVGLVIGFVGATVAFRQYLYWWHVGPILSKRKTIRSTTKGLGLNPLDKNNEVGLSYRERSRQALPDLIAFEKWQAHKAKVRSSRLSWLYPEPPGFVAENRAQEVFHRIFKEPRPARFHQSSRPITEDKPTGTDGE